MSLFRKAGLTLCALVMAFGSGCYDEKAAADRRHAAQAAEEAKKKTEKYKYTELIEEHKEKLDDQTDEIGEEETIETKIIDVQDGTINYQSSGAFQYKFVKVKGGGAKEGMLLLYGWPKYFERYTPVKLTYRKLKTKQITAKEFYKMHGDSSYHVYDDFNYLIRADGIIIPDGVEFMRGKNE